MRLSDTGSDAFCPICALAGMMSMLHMEYDNLGITCLMGHKFNTLELSKLASKHEVKT